MRKVLALIFLFSLPLLAGCGAQAENTQNQSISPRPENDPPAAPDKVAPEYRNSSPEEAFLSLLDAADRKDFGAIYDMLCDESAKRFDNVYGLWKWRRRPGINYKPEGIEVEVETLFGTIKDEFASATNRTRYIAVNSRQGQFLGGKLRSAVFVTSEIDGVFAVVDYIYADSDGVTCIGRMKFLWQAGGWKWHDVRE